MRCPEGNKEKIDDHPLFVSPCILSTTVNLMQECGNKVAQKSQHRIGRTGRLFSIKEEKLTTRKEELYGEYGMEEIWDVPKALLLSALPYVLNIRRFLVLNNLGKFDGLSGTAFIKFDGMFYGMVYANLLPISNIYATDTTQLSRQFHSSSDYPSIPLETTFSMIITAYKLMKIDWQYFVTFKMEQIILL